MGWGPAEVVEKLKPFEMDVTSQTIINWREGKSAPDADKLDVLAMALGVHYARFYPDK
jgi:transcriptional regulator with XRE-family HTH domain